MDRVVIAVGCVRAKGDVEGARIAGKSTQMQRLGKRMDENRKLLPDRRQNDTAQARQATVRIVTALWLVREGRSRQTLPGGLREQIYGARGSKKQMQGGVNI